VRIHYVTIGMLLCMLPWHASATEAGTTLKQAMDIAKETHPELKMSALNVEAARNALTEQSSYAYNPELSLEAQDRSLANGESGRDYYIGISQGIELGGKQGYRQAAFYAALNASSQRAELAEQRISINVSRAFVQYFFAKKALDIRHQQSEALKKLRASTQRQLDVGDTNILEVNLANSVYASALSAEEDARSSLTTAQFDYYKSLGQFVKDDDFNLILPRLFVDWAVPSSPFDIALASRPDVAMLQSKVEQRDAEMNLASANRMPDPTLSIAGGREGDDKILSVAISFPLPLWNSHSGAYQSSVAKATLSRDKELWFKERLRFDVQAAVKNHESAMHTLKISEQVELSGSRMGNFKLAQTAYKAGELSFGALVIHINQSLDARLTSLNIIKKAWLARIHLAEVLGQPKYILQGSQL